MQKTITTLAITTTLSVATYASDITATTQSIRAFALPKDSISLGITYKRANNAIDFLNINDTADPLQPYSAIGDSAGAYLSIGYGLNQFISLFYNVETLNIHYAGDSLNNVQNDLYARINFYDVPHYSFDDFSMDVGYVRNSADDFNNMQDLSDDSFYLRLLLGSKFSTSLLNFYTGFKYTSIDGTLSGADVSRSEKSLILGISHTIEFSRFILDSRYEYSRIFDRESALTKNKSNHLFDINLAYAIYDNFLIYVGTDIMLNQFNGLIPYLYNSQTQDAFDKRYALMKLGFVYNFDFAKNRK